MIVFTRVYYLFGFLTFIAIFIFSISCFLINNENITETFYQYKENSEGEIVMEDIINDSDKIKPAVDLAIPDQLDTATLAMG